MSKALRLIFVIFLLVLFSFIAQEGFPAGPNSDRGQSQQLEIGQEEKEANRLQPPDRIMDAIGVKPGMVIGEVGAGKGRFTVHLAARVGGEGKVYANDIDADALAFLRDRSVRQARAQAGSSVLARRESTRIDAPNSPGLQTLTGPYLGQKPPGLTPEVFAPGLVSKAGDQGRLFIAPDGYEIIYWEREPINGRMHIISVRNSGGVWSEPEALPFSEEYINNEPCLSPDGKRLFFVSNRPRSGKGEGEKLPDIWMVEKSAGKWGEPRNLGDPVNRLDIAVQPFYAVDDRLYFGGQAADGSSRGIYVSRFAGGGFSEPEKLDEGVFGGQVNGLCVSPDNRTLLVHARKEGGFGSWDLYASFRDAAGNWGALVNLGDAVNTEAAEAGASYSPDGKYMFFSRGGDIYWVSAKILEGLRPNKRSGSPVPLPGYGRGRILARIVHSSNPVR